MVVDLTCGESRACRCLPSKPDASTRKCSTACGVGEVETCRPGVTAEKLKAAARAASAAAAAAVAASATKAEVRKPRPAEKKKQCARQPKEDRGDGKACSHSEDCGQSSRRGAAEATGTSTSTAGRDTGAARVYCGSGGHGEVPMMSQPQLPEGVPSSRLPKQPTDRGLFEL